MNVVLNIVLAVQMLSAVVMVALILIQHGKGADMGAAFGSGASGSLFGATGSSNFMSKSTGVAAAIFFSATLALSYITTHQTNNVSGGVMDKVQATVPAAPASAPAVAPAAPAPAAPAAPAPANSIPK